MKRLVALAWAVSALTAVTTRAHGEDDVDLAPSYQPHEQTDSERLQNFREPPPPPTTYPNISGSERNDPRLYINRDVSLGGNIGAHGVEGNVRFPIPGRH
jgi:hypothetical protein